MYYILLYILYNIYSTLDELTVVNVYFFFHFSLPSFITFMSTYLLSQLLPGMLYSIEIQNTFLKRVRYLKSVIHESNRNPIESLSIRTNVKRRFDDEDLGEGEDEMKNYYRFQLTYNTLEIIRLPSPYDTFCMNYKQQVSMFSAIECRNSCLLNRTLERIQKIPFSITIWNATELYLSYIESGEFTPEIDWSIDYYAERLDYYSSLMKFQHLSNLDIARVDISDQMVTIEDECDRQCYRPDCNETLTMTTVHYDYPEMKESNDNIPLTFEVMVPTKPSVRIIHGVKMSWTEYLVSVLSCFGIWFGLSILSVNPFKLTFHFASRAVKNHRPHKVYCERVRKQLDRQTEQFIKKTRALVNSIIHRH